MFFVYIIYSEKFDKFYIGQTNDVDKRLSRHNNGLANYTKKYIPWTLKLIIEKNSRSDAMTLEKKLKNLSKQRLIDFIINYS